MVLQYDVGRPLFIASAASQLAGLRIQSKIPSTRFTVDVLDLPSFMVQIHLISIGGRSYISNLSGSVVNCDTQDSNSRCYDIREKSYLATKSDGIGIVDIAFEQEEGHPKWILNNRTDPFTMELSQIRYASLQSLRIVRDVCLLTHLVFCYVLIFDLDSQMPSYYAVQPGAGAIFSQTAFSSKESLGQPRFFT